MRLQILKNEWPTSCSFFVYLLIKKMIVASPVLADVYQHHNSFHMGMFDALNSHFGDDVEGGMVAYTLFIILSSVIGHCYPDDHIRHCILIMTFVEFFEEYVVRLIFTCLLFE